MLHSPRFQSPRVQRLSVTAAMGFVFIGTVALAYLTAAVSRPSQAEAFTSPQRIVVEGLALTLPGAWVEDAAASRELGLNGALVLRDPERSQRWLLVTTVRYTEPEPVAPHEMTTRFLSNVLTPAQVHSLQPLVAGSASSRDGLTIAEYMADSRPPRGSGRQLHMIASATTDGKRYWLIYMTDRIDAGESATTVIRRNMALFNRIEQSAQLEDRS